MAKKSMNIKYKSRKRVRNKNKETQENENVIKSFGLTLAYVVVFLGISYLAILGLQKLGLFLEGYTAPNSEASEFDYEFINANTVFNRSEKEYLVLFDNYDSDYTSDAYINDLVKNSKVRVYKVDMSKEYNAKYKGKEANKKASKTSKLSINDITLIKIKSGRVSEYIVGSDKIEEYLTK